MTKRQLKQGIEQLRTALEVYAKNDISDPIRDRVKVGIRYWGRTSCLSIHTPNTDQLDVVQMTKEMEKIFPNSRITSIFSGISNGCIRFVMKDLGQRDSRVIDIFRVTS